MIKVVYAITTALSALLLGVLAFLSVSGMIDPAASAARFGVPAEDFASQFYHAVYRDRNLVLAATGLVFLGARMWRALAILVTICVTLPLYDIYALLAADLPVVAVHPVTLGALVVLTGLLWIRVLASKK